jgi:hypothetical protein
VNWFGDRGFGQFAQSFPLRLREDFANAQPSVQAVGDRDSQLSVDRLSGIFVGSIQDTPTNTGPDLVITDVDVGSQDLDFGETVTREFRPGETLSVEIDITNQGNAAAGTSRAAVYLVVNGVTQLMDTNSTQSLAAGARDTNEVLSFTLPSNLQPGTYSVILITDYQNAVAETDEGNNGTGFFIRVIDPGEPDLVITDVDVGSQDMDFGETVTELFGAGANFGVTIDIRNQGDGDAPSSASAVYLVVNGENRLMDTNSTTSLGAGASDLNESLSFVIPANIAAGTYSVIVITDYRNDVDESDETNNGTGFFVRLADDYADEPGESGTINGVGTLGVGSSASGWIGLTDSNDDAFGDRDAFLVSLIEGRTYTFVVDGSQGLTDAVFSIRDASFDRVGDLSTEGDPATLTFTAPSTGNFFVRVGTGTAGQTGAYTLSVTEEQSPDLIISDVAVGSQSLVFGDTVTQVFSPGETVSVQFNVDNQGNASAPASTAALYLSINGVAQILATNPTDALAGGASDTNEVLSFTIPTDLNAGTYSVILITDYQNTVSEGNESNNGTGFFITVAGSDSDDYADQPGDGGTINGVGSLDVGQTVSGVIGPADLDDTYGDKDVFRVRLEAGQTYRINLQALGLPLGIFTLRDPGNFSNVLQVSAIGRSPSTEFSVDVTGDYWIRVGTGGAASDQGSYRLSVTDITSSTPTDDFPDTPGDTSAANGIPSLSQGASRTGQIETAGDTDIFAVNLVAGQRYQFFLDNEAIGSLGELPSVYMTLRDGSNFSQRRGEGPGGQQATIRFDAEETGTYFIRVGAGGSGQVGGYRVSFSGLGATPQDPPPEDTGPVENPVLAALDALSSAIGETSIELFLNDATWNAFLAAFIKLDDQQLIEFAKKVPETKIFGFIPIMQFLDIGNDLIKALEDADPGEERRAVFVQLIDSLAETLLVTGVASLGALIGTRAAPAGPPAVAALAGGATDFLYDYTLSFFFEGVGGLIFDAFLAESAQDSPTSNGTQPTLDEAELIAFDEDWYLETYPDVAEALRDGTVGSAYAHFLTTGIDLGYQPNPAQSLTRADLVTELFQNNPLALGNAAVLTLNLGEYAGDGVTAEEAALATAINAARGSAGELDLDAILTAFASRKANDLVANFLDSPVTRALFESNGAWAEAWSNGNQLTQQFRGALEALLGESADAARYRLFVVPSQSGAVSDVLARLQGQEGFSAALANSDFDTIGIAEFGGLWVVVLADREPAYTVTAPGEDTLDRTVQFGTAESDVMYAGLRSSVIYGLSGDDRLSGSALVDRLTGGLGDDTLNGGSNVDFAIVSGTRAQYTITQTSTGVFRLVGPDGTDTLTAIEFLQFDDQTIRLRPGTGVSVNFNSTDRTVYQSAMNAIRDFDGNVLGGNGSWLRIGQADVNGDGDIDQILVNNAIGRFATVGTAPDGLVYFSDHGWAGETRVAGIYIDPLVAAGIVQAGSPNDSQRRFQNDLQIENINRVLGANDYDRDGLQEVYFALTDGTAYLRAIMEFDGNIRYANYQSQQEVIDYLAANGFGQETWGTWFTRPSDGEAILMQERIDLAEASGLGRAELPLMPGLDTAMPGSINPSTLAFAAPALEDHLRAEFYG